MSATDIRRKHLCYLDSADRYGLGDIVQCDECGVYFKLCAVGLFSAEQWIPMTRLGIWWAVTRKARKAAR